MEKATPLKIYINGSFEDVEFNPSFKVFGTADSKTIFADARDWEKFYPSIEDKVTDIVVEQDRRNSAIPLMDLTNTKARIERVHLFVNTQSSVRRDGRVN